MDYKETGNRIRSLRRARGWSQELFAKKCGISTAFAGHIERGTRAMSLDTFTAVCEALGADANELLWGASYKIETDLKAAWGQERNKDSDSYAVYVQIMKSVADIMGRA